MKVKVFKKEYSEMEMDAKDVVSFFNTCDVTYEQLLNKLEKKLVQDIEQSARSEYVYGIQLSSDEKYWTTMEPQTMNNIKWRDVSPTEQALFDDIKRLKQTIFALKLIK